VIVDGSSVGVASSYTFTNVQTNHTISATFSAIVPIVGPTGLGVIGAVLGAISILALRRRRRPEALEGRPDEPAR
jgi:hypothetical protein